MSFKGKFLSGLTLAVAVGAFGTMASAQDTPQKDQTQKQEKPEGRRGMHKMGEFGQGGEHRGGMFGLRSLDLTDAQKQQIKAIMETNRPDQATMDEMRTLSQAKRDGSITADQQARLTQLRTDMRTHRELVHQQVLAILTPEQKQQLEQKQQEMKARREQWKQNRDMNKPTPEKPKDN
jgi:protein CpxP